MAFDESKTRSAPTAPAELTFESAKPKGSPRPSGQTRNSTNGGMYMQTGNNKIMVRRIKKKRGDGFFKGLARWFLENQIGLSFNLLALLFLTHVLLPKARSSTSKFFTLSHYNPKTGNYGVGDGDLYFIGFCVVLFTGLRALVMEQVLSPLARSLGLLKRKEVARFAEQTWMLCYYAVFWTMGLYIYSNSKYFLNMKELWTDWPTRELPFVNKFYVLAQWSFWIQQVFVIHIEDRRKDHFQMLTHHFITIALLSTSYAMHFTRVGILILVLMDVNDILLPIAKCLKYLGYMSACDVMFGVFMVAWFVARHVFYNMALLSIWNDVPGLLPNVCFRGSQNSLAGPFPLPDKGWAHMFEPLWYPTGQICFSGNVRWAFLAGLGSLQVILIMWFVMVIQVAARVIRGDGAGDTRSDDEGGEEENEDEESEYEEAEPLEEEVGVEALDLKGWERRTGVKRTASTSGVSLPGHSDRKELLGRIGCEKQVE